jgi:hypothetical protein
LYRRVLKDRGLLVAILVIATGVVLFIRGSIITPTSNPSINPLEEYVKAVKYLNESSIALEKLLLLNVTQSLDIEDAARTRNRIVEVYYNYSSTYGSSGNYMVKTAEGYLRVAEAGLDSARAYRVLEGVANVLRNSLRLVSVCRIREALEAYYSIRRDLYNATSLLRDAVSMLVGVDYNYIAENHVSVVKESHRRIERTLYSLINAMNLLELVDKYSVLIEKMCSRQSLSQSDIPLLNEMAIQLQGVSATGPLYQDIADAKQGIISLVNKYMNQSNNQSDTEPPSSSQNSGQLPGGGQGGSQQPSQDSGQIGSQPPSQGQQIPGMGAGYVPPESDD